MNPQDPSQGGAPERPQAQPGQTIPPQAPIAAPPSAPVPPIAPPSLPSPVQPPSEEHFYRPEDDAQSADAPDSAFVPQTRYPAAQSADSNPVSLSMQHDGQGVSWTASEFIIHHKTPEWFLTFIIVTLVAVIATYLISRDVLSAVAVLVAGAIFGFGANRPPRQKQYALSAEGVSIGSHTYPYANFRSFSLVYEDAIPSIVLLPLKRFMPVLTIYFDAADEDAIAEVLAGYLPMHEHSPDFTERLMRRIRF